MQIRTYFFLRVRSDLFLSAVYEMERALQWENPSLQGSFFAYICYFKTAVKLLYFVLAHDYPATETTVFLFPLGGYL